MDLFNLHTLTVTVVEKTPVRSSSSSSSSISMNRTSDNGRSGLYCAALATGMKCLPQHKLTHARGNVLHDWHAEILAIRAFNRFLVDECAHLAKRGFNTDGSEGWLRWRKQYSSTDSEDSLEQSQPFELDEDVSIHMYCSEAPCGDASMELTMAEQEDDTPWPSAGVESVDSETTMLGRGHFDQLGIVRRKPARPDAPATLSKSCSDKLAMKQCTSLLSSLTSKLMWPENVYLDTVVLPEAQIVRSAVQRAFSAEGRMRPVANDDAQVAWQPYGYEFRPFEIVGTTRVFEYSKRPTSDEERPVPSNLSALATPRRQEILINGVRQGRKQFDPRGASSVSRRSMWTDVLVIANTTEGFSRVADGLSRKPYGEAKKEQSHRERVKNDVRKLTLTGWKKNVGDEDWMLEAG
jgi:tRNA-specific adenosine deaminase 1